MLSNRLMVAALGAACITAAAGGGYFAARQNTVPTPASAQTQAEGVPLASTPAAAAATTRPVQETEAVVGDTSKPALAPERAPEPAASKPVRRPDPLPPSRTASSTPARPRSTSARNDPAPLSSTWPSSAAQTPNQPPSLPSAGPVNESGSSPRNDERAQEPVRAPEPPQKIFEELVVSADSVIGLQTENRLSSETARVEDKVEAKVTRDVKVGDRVAIPAGSHALGSVMEVDRGGKFKDRARLGIRFHTLVLADGTRVPISTDTIYREGLAPTNSSAAKVGGAAVGGAILGAILGGAKGAAIGATAGAGGGTAAVMAGDRPSVVVPPGTAMTIRILAPLTVTKEREE